MDEKCLKFINVKRKNVQCLQDKYILKVKQTKLQVKRYTSQMLSANIFNIYMTNTFKKSNRLNFKLKDTCLRGFRKTGVKLVEDIRGEDFFNKTYSVLSRLFRYEILICYLQQRMFPVIETTV